MPAVALTDAILYNIWADAVAARGESVCVQTRLEVELCSEWWDTGGCC